MPLIHIEGRRWFQRSAGNTYHSARVFIDGTLAHNSDRHYGYREQYLQTAIDWLRANGHIPAETRNACATLYLRETLGGSYSVIDVARQKDL